ncbi:hypothetical protein BGY98DRAFT_948249, partial [Russula aff. rugulosa BPL654]
MGYVHKMFFASLAISSLHSDVRLNLRIYLGIHGPYLDEYDGESSRRPNPYCVTFTPRHDRVQVLLEAEE